jgi:hypothetical protein
MHDVLTRGLVRSELITAGAEMDAIGSASRLAPDPLIPEHYRTTSLWALFVRGHGCRDRNARIPPRPSHL